MSAEDEKKIRDATGGLGVKDLSHRLLLEAVNNPDRHLRV